MIKDDIKKMLDRGDYVKIARIAGTNRKYVYEVLSGRIKGTRGIGKQIILAAQFIAKQNKNIGKI